MGLTYDQALDIPIGELLDYVAIEQVKHEDAKLISSGITYDEEVIPDVR